MTKSDDKRVPALRFKGFTDDWEQRKLGDYGSVAMNKRIFKNQTNTNSGVPFYKIGTFGKKADAFISKKLFEEYRKKYPYPKKGDLLISASGSIGRVIEYTGQQAYYQDSNIVWLNHNDNLENIYLKAYYQIIHWSGIEGSTIKRLYNKNILNTKIYVPIKDEQFKVGTIIDQIEKLITLQQRKLERLKSLKKAYLRLIFNTSESIHYLKDIAEYRRGSFPQPYTKREWYGGKDSQPFVQVADVNTNLRLFSKTKETISKKAQQNSVFVPKDTIVVTLQGSIGRVAITQYDSYVDRTLLIITKLKKRIDKYYLAYALQEKFNIEKRKAPGGTIKTITKSTLSNFAIILPNFEKQSQQSQTLKTIDNEIYLINKKLDKLVQFKQFLLQNMFI